MFSLARFPSMYTLTVTIHCFRCSIWRILDHGTKKQIKRILDLTSCVDGKRRCTLTAFSDNCGYSLILHGNSTCNNFLKLSCSVEFETISMNLLFSILLKSIGLSCSLNGSFLSFISTILNFLINIFNWSIVDLQCHINFCYTAKWSSYTHTHIYNTLFFKYSFPLWFSIGF